VQLQALTQNVKEITLFDRYRLEYAIGAGTYGAVHSSEYSLS
jgi:hypothetical protein